MKGLDIAVDSVIGEARTVLGENTVVIFQSDNGASTWLGGLNGPLRSGKTTSFEGDRPHDVRCGVVWCGVEVWCCRVV